MLVLKQWKCLKHQTSGSSQGLNVYNMFIYGCSVSRSFLNVFETTHNNRFVPHFDMDAAWCSPFLSFDSAGSATAKSVTGMTGMSEVLLDSCLVTVFDSLIIVL